MELVPVMEDLYFELYEEGELSKLDDREYLRIFIERTLKGMKYVSQSKRVVVSLSMKEIKLESLCFQKN